MINNQYRWNKMTDASDVGPDTNPSDVPGSVSPLEAPE